jgi:hypothetical protein
MASSSKELREAQRSNVTGSWMLGGGDKNTCTHSEFERIKERDM